MSTLKSSVSKYRGRVCHAKHLPFPSRLRRIVVTTILSLVSFATTASALVYYDLNSQIKTLDKTQTLLKRESKPVDSYSGRAINILVIGSDTRAGEGNQTLTSNEDTSQRSDTTLLVHVSADRSRIEAVSIPRDTLVDIPACPRSDGGTFAPRSNTQFNWAFSLGAGEDNELSGAVACTWKTVEKLTGLTIDESVVVDFNGFQHMVNALGGINVFVDSPIDDPDNTGLIINEPGCRHMEGAEALAYSRVRHGILGGDGSDYQRIKRQQDVLGIMLNTALRKNLFTNASSLYSFARAGLSSLTISNGLASVNSLTGLAWSLRSIDLSRVVFLTMPTTADRVDPNRLREYQPLSTPVWEALAKDQPLPVGLEVRNAKGEGYETGDAALDPFNADRAKLAGQGEATANGQSGQNGASGTDQAEIEKNRTESANSSGQVEAKNPKAATSNQTNFDLEELARLKQRCLVEGK